MKISNRIILCIFRNYSSNSKLKTKTIALHELLIAMPKEQAHIPFLKTGRTQKRDTAGKFPAGYINLEILGCGAKGAPASLYVFTDQMRYLFNCGEGTQRLAHEHKMKLAKLEHVFFTKSSWKNIGGVPGLALTIQDIGVPSITLHGPPGLENLFEGTQRFVILKDLQIRVSDCLNDEDSFHEDHVMRIDYVPILKSKADTDVDSDDGIEEKDEVEDKIDYYEPIKGYKRNLQITQGGGSPKKSKIEEDSIYNVGKRKPNYDAAVCYICRPKKKAGALLIEKCLEYGVPSGPLLGQLKSGEDVTLPNGTVVKADSVRSPDAPCTVFLVVDCPSEAYLDSFLSNEKLLNFQGDVPVDDIVQTIIHFTPPEILSNPRYIEWMQKFRISTCHILLSEINNTGMGSEAVHRVQIKLNLLDSNIFPLLKDFSDTGADVSSSASNALTQAKIPVVYGVTQFKHKLRPLIQQCTDTVVKINPQEYLDELTALPEFQPALENLQSQFKELKGKEEEYPRLVFLGTGSCIPNKTRNTSAILLQLSSSSYFILDCGEGTYGQLVRFFGPDSVDDVLTTLNGIYVSHLHADHHLGLINLLQRREVAFQNKDIEFRPVFLLAPLQILSWLHLYHRSFEKLKHLYQLVPVTDLLHSNCSLDPSFSSHFYSTLSLRSIETVPVRHCPNAYGISLTGLEGWKITYSGDTMPTDYLVTLGMDSDILIHEATMEDELREEAIIKMHSTTSEAIEIGKKMNAKFIMLTHFSQRYSKVPKINGELEKNVGVAFDNMSVKLSDLSKISMMYPVLKIMFAESYEEMEAKTAKKLKKRQKEIEQQ